MIFFFGKIKYRERNQPLHSNHWGILVLFKGPWTWSQNGYRWYYSKSKSSCRPPPLLPRGTLPQPAIDAQTFAIYPLVFFSSCKVLIFKPLTSSKGLGQPRQVPEPSQGPIGLPSRRMDVLAVRRRTSLPNLVSCTLFDRRFLPVVFFFFFFFFWLRLSKR